MLFSTTDVTMKKTLHINPNINKSKERVFVRAEKQTRFPFNYRF